MTDLLQQGSDWLADQMATHAATDVDYLRGVESVSVAATIGKTDFEIDDGSGNIQHIQSRDFLILSAALILEGSQIVPQAGDLIRETRGSDVFVYEVMAPGNEPPWRYSDPYRRLLRIHTKQIAMEEV